MRQLVPILLTLVFGAGLVTAQAGTLETSMDGTCGEGVTCQGSKWGDCCSSHGYCGNTEGHCGIGCQAGSGTCGGGGNNAPAPPGSRPSAGLVVYETETRTVWETGTRTTTQTETATRTVTSVVSSIAVVASLVRTTSTFYATETTTTTARSTRVFYETTTTQVVEVVTTLSVILETSTRRITQTQTEKVRETARITQVVTQAAVVTRTAVITQAAAASCRASNNVPSVVRPGGPTLPGTTANCRKYYQTREGDACRRIASNYGISPAQLKNMNPGLDGRVKAGESGGLLCPLLGGLLGGSCDGEEKMDCNSLLPGFYLCVEGV